MTVQRKKSSYLFHGLFKKQLIFKNLKNLKNLIIRLSPKALLSPSAGLESADQDQL